MVYPREVLNKLRWTEGESLQEAVIWYIHRGAPGDCAKISGKDITALGKGFFELGDTSIPYHRILRIDYRGKTVFRKDARADSLS
jgi:uncharacterized protein (UPF0248 family)